MCKNSFLLVLIPIHCANPHLMFPFFAGNPPSILSVYQSVPLSVTQGGGFSRRYLGRRCRGSRQYPGRGRPGLRGRGRRCGWSCRRRRRQLVPAPFIRLGCAVHFKRPQFPLRVPSNINCAKPGVTSGSTKKSPASAGLFLRLFCDAHCAPPASGP